MRTSENYSNKLILQDGSKNIEAYNDSYVRSKMEQVLFEYMGWDLIDNKNQYGIDKVFYPHEKYGVELEHGGFDTDNYFEDKRYAFKSGLDFPTLNMQKRKLKFYLKDKMWYKEDWNNKNSPWLYTNNVIEKEKNIFCRTNVKCDHFIIVRPEMVLNEKYILRDIFCENSQKLESFCCFRKEDVEIYNIIDNKLVKK